MSTSLQKQLQALKVSQKDEISMPSRTKVSFLFEIKKAANIDDQTLFYLMEKGLQEIEEQEPKLYEQLSVFTNEILNESSLEFYRGTQNKDQLKAIDDQLEQILHLISPYLMLPGVHKVIEYMVRIYEVQAHQKHSFIMIFLPYFETAYFLKAIQLVSLKDDEFFSFLHQYAYQGESIDSKIIVRALSRNHGVLFAKYSRWFFDQGLTAVLDDDKNSTSQNLHHKFLGTMMVEVIRETKEDQVLMFNVLPSISQSLKSSAIELKHSGLLSIGHLCSFKALSKEYTLAFVKQTILIMKDSEFDDALKQRSLTILMVIIQYQSYKCFDPQDLTLLLKVPKLGKIIQRLSQSHDISLLLRSFVETIITQETEKDLISQVHKILKLKDLINLKTQFLIVSSILNHLVFEQSGCQEDLALSILKLLKEVDTQSYNQTLLYSLKQTQDKEQKSRLKQIIQGDEKGAIFQTVGDVEYSLLSALGSTRKSVKLSAMASIENNKTLTNDEADLIQLFLAQIIQRCEDDEEMMISMLTALSSITKKFRKTKNQDDIIFESVDKMINAAGSIYSPATVQKAVSISISLEVSKETNLKAQSLMAYFFDKKSCFSTYSNHLLTLKGNKLQDYVKDNLDESFELLTYCFQNKRTYYGFDKLDYLVSVVMDSFRSNESGSNQTVSNLIKIKNIVKDLKNMGKGDGEAVGNLLSSIIRGLPVFSQLSKSAALRSITNQIVGTIISVTLIQKQLNSDFNLAKVHNQIKEFQFGSSDSLYCEFWISIALKQNTSEEPLKRIFAILYLTDLLENRYVIDPTFLLPIIMMLLTDKNSKIRNYAMKLAHTFTQNHNNRALLEVFQDTEKPKSAKKSQNTLTPLKPGKAVLFLEELMKFDSDIVQDSSQLGTFMNKSKHKDIFEIMLRTLLDWPTFEMKSQLFEMLSLVDDHTIIFSMTLSDMLKRLYCVKDFIKKGEKVQAKDELVVLLSAGNLINRVCNQDKGAESVKALVLSLVLPFLHYLNQQFLEINADMSPYEYQQVDSIIILLVQKSLFESESLKLQDQTGMVSLIKLYLKLFKNLKNTSSRASIKATFLEQTAGLIEGKTIKVLMKEIKDGLAKAGEISDCKEQSKVIQGLNLELILETLTVLELKEDYSLLDDAFSVLRSLTALVLRDDQDQQKDGSNGELFFSIEMTCQVCMQIIENNSKKNAQAIRVQDPSKLTQDLLTQTIDSLRETVQAYLEHQFVDKNDPFNQFMMVVDSKADADMDEIDETGEHLQEHISSTLKIIKSLSGLMLKCQSEVDGSLQKSEQYLNMFSTYVQNLQAHDEAQTLKYAEIINQLFRFFHRETIKIVQIEDGENLAQDFSHQRNILTQYISTVQVIVSNYVAPVESGTSGSLSKSSKQEDLKQMLLAVVQASGLQSHGHITAFILIALSKESISLTADMKLDCPLLNYARSIIVQATMQSGSLRCIQNLLLDLVALPLNEAQMEYIDQKFKIINSDLVDQARAERTWLTSKEFISQNAKDLRKLKFMILYVLELWLTKDGEMMTVLASIAGQDPSEEIQEQFLNCYLLLGIMKDGLNNYLSDKDYKQEDKGKSQDAKGSTKRLAKRVDSMLDALNQMVSHEIHASMVLKIMTLKHTDILSLKTNAIQLLLNKTSEFNFSLSTSKQVEMVSIFNPLLEEAIRCLKKDMTKANLQKSSEKQTYAATLFALFSRTASKELSQEIQEQTLQLSMSFVKNQLSYPLTLNTQLILSQSQIFEVYNTQILEHLPLHIDQLLEAFDRAHEAKKRDEFFSESFTQAILKATLSVITMFAKFLNIRQLEELLKNVIIVDKAYESQVEAILNVLSKDGPKSVGLKQLFQVVFNTFDDILLQKGAKKLELQSNIANVSLRYFGSLLKPVVMRMKKEFCAENFKKISQFFKEIFSFPQQYYKSNNKVDLLSLDQIEASMVAAFQQFVIKLNEDQLGPAILLLVKWASKPPKDENMFNINMHRQIILYKALSGTVEALGEYAVPFIKLQMDNTTGTLKSLITNFQKLSLEGVGKKRARVAHQNPELLEAKSMDGQGHTMHKLLVKVCENVTLNFKHDNGAFIQTDIYEVLAEPLVAELVTLQSLGNNYAPFIEETVKPLVFEMNDRINNESLWIKLNNAILLKTRIEHPAIVRQSALKIVEHMFSKLGERFLVVLNDTLSFLSESLEDENPDVEAVAKLIVKRIESLTGESIQEYLK